MLNRILNVCLLLLSFDLMPFENCLSLLGETPKFPALHISFDSIWIFITLFLLKTIQHMIFCENV